MFFEKAQVVKETCYFGRQHTEKLFNVAYGIDRNFLFGSMISMTSLLMNNLDIRFSFHIFSDYIDDDYRFKIQELCEKYDTHVIVYVVYCDALKKLPSTKNWSYAMYFRFLAFDFIDSTENQILYLDADIVCKKSIKGLLSVNLDKKIAAAVKDGDLNFWQERATTFGRPEIAKGYFNSGVMLVDTKSWSDNNITEKAIKMLENSDIQQKIKFPDQDVLNILLCESILFIDRIYNSQTSINFELQCSKGQYYQHSISDETVFIHYIGPTKPWHIWAQYPVSDYFYLAKKNSPWQVFPLLKPSSSSLIRYQAKHDLHQRKWCSGVKAYINYFLSKAL